MNYICRYLNIRELLFSLRSECQYRNKYFVENLVDFLIVEPEFTAQRIQAFGNDTVKKYGKNHPVVVLILAFTSHDLLFWQKLYKYCRLTLAQ